MDDGPRYQPFLDLPEGTFRWRLGLRPLDLDDWLQFDEHADRELAEKQRLIATYPNTVVVVDPSDAMIEASAEIYHAVAADVARQRGSGHVIDMDELHPIDAAGRIVQEDLVVMIERDGQLICGGGSVCFPNRWDLSAKVGLTMDAVHAPVPQLNTQLGAAIDRRLMTLTPERAFWRLGWTVLDTDDLYQAVDGTATVPTPPSRPGDYWLRVERETIRRFPTTGAVLFTIRTYLSPIRSVPIASRSHLAAALDAMDPDILDYKALGGAGPVVADWLRANGSTL